MTGSGITAALFSHKLFAKNEAAQSKIINAYYFRAHTYTLVPRHIREDMKWMADVGTNAVSLAILEQDLFAAKENLEIICNEAAKAGIDVFAVPSRWAGLFAGAPKVPSPFAVNHPRTWILDKDGNPPDRGVFGPYSSIHYPETVEFFKKTVDEIFSIWQVKGIIWDEPKIFTTKDFSPKAIENLGADAPVEKHCRAFVNFLSDVNLHIKRKHPEKITSMFGYANLPTWVVELAATTRGLDYFGCDGRPWRTDDRGTAESEGKVLLGDDAGERFLTAARKNGKKTFWLIENHNLQNEDIPIMEKRLPEVIGKDIDLLTYYYYPRNLEDPDRNMAVIGKYVREFAKKYK